MLPSLQNESMKKIYISIPISGMDLNEVMHRANQVKVYLMQSRNVSAITPFDVVQTTEGEFDGNEEQFYAYCMGKDIEALLKCDAIFMCCGWQHSKGCRAEHSIAEIYGKDIIIESQTNNYEL